MKKDARSKDHKRRNNEYREYYQDPKMRMLEINQETKKSLAIDAIIFIEKFKSHTQETRGQTIAQLVIFHC
jgi:hypothetical protein